MEEGFLRAYAARKAGMVFLARLAHDETARSYRKFRVGAAVLCRNPCGDFQVFSAQNIKRPCRRGSACHCSEGEDNGGEGHSHNPKPRKKCCAERRAIRLAERAGYPFVVAVAVVGDIQVDNESGVETDLLEPCGVCRAAFKRLVRDSRMESGAPILCAHPSPESGVLPQEQVLWQILAKHEGKRTQAPH